MFASRPAGIVGIDVQINTKQKMSITPERIEPVGVV
jgi:hypothetical protein